ncbi:CMGC protein kinase [Nannizzia gypsea CBS 118893]|uniref:CMGC protein kinase n=1 Tax=Arthroderma gypseum (strain ATCC MYA-4604 / CBS 118893) TaxID=535722 RepID=E4UUE6_ARTGP|nr:CMGC protein kinase [Nannizzia gypsea CBS 118893]EFR00913.1 CMGC protein kinase [Nannizzia gypsea CBS 118893]
MKSLKRAITRSFSCLRRKPLPIPPTNPLLAANELVDEEICPGYNPNKFYPARPGDVLDNRYQILVKVGWGVSSTVWFARDMRGYQYEPEGVVALKITNANQPIDDECGIENHIFRANPSHRGRALFRTSSECFEITSSAGKHMCLAYEPMREPLWLFKRRFKDEAIPLPLVKTYVRLLLVGLDYLHTECKVVHTDLKLENIMVSFEDPAVLGDFMGSLYDTPMQYKIDSTGRPVYRCHNDFGPLRKLRNIPKIVDFGHSVKFDSEDDLMIQPIQPDHYRAPEVILGCGWGMSTDIWNLGVLLWDIFENKELFRLVYDANGQYNAKGHLAEMIALLGPPPPDLVARSRSTSEYQWPEPIVREDGQLCGNSREYFGGPFFDDNGNFLHEDLIPDRRFDDTAPSLDSEQREKFLSFVKRMVTWLPEERATARELAEHPFLQLK